MSSASHRDAALPVSTANLTMPSNWPYLFSKSISNGGTNSFKLEGAPTYRSSRNDCWKFSRLDKSAGITSKRLQKVSHCSFW